MEMQLGAPLLWGPLGTLDESCLERSEILGITRKSIKIDQEMV